MGLDLEVVMQIPIVGQITRTMAAESRTKRGHVGITTNSILDIKKRHIATA